MESNRNIIIENEDLFNETKTLEVSLKNSIAKEFLLKEDIKNLKKQLLYAKEEVKRIQSIPLVIGHYLETIDNKSAVVSTSCCTNVYVPVLSTIDRELLKPNAAVALHRSSKAVVFVLPPESDSNIKVMRPEDKPDVTFAMIGGLDMQKQELKEAVELPLTHPELYRQVGIEPPRGVLLYGPPGCGKTMMAKAIANETSAAFIAVNGSEFVQKYLGEGPRMVRDIFRMAKENAPSIIFIDEVDAIATKRFDSDRGSDREVQRILIELLNQMDGFDQTVNVKIIMATNRADTIDPALLRPGRLDRKIAFPLPEKREKRLIFSTITSEMNIGDDVNIDELASRPDQLSAAQINSICQEAGMSAVRENRYVVLAKDFEKGYKSNVKREENLLEFYM